MWMKMHEEKYMRFPGGKAKAATFSYDDGAEADIRLMSIFDKYGIKATFNLNNPEFINKKWTRRLPEDRLIKTFSSCGHEIALHGERHLFLDKVPLPQAINEVVQNRVYLESKFGRIVRGMAYAYGGYNDEVVAALKQLGVIYARTTEVTHSFDIPRDWLRLKATCHHTDPVMPELVDKFISSSPLEQTKAREPKLLYIWGHSFEFDDNNNWDLIENTAKKLSACKDIWFATNSEVYDYVKAYENLIWSVDGERVKNPSYMGVYVEIRGKIYEIGAGEEIVFDKEN
ncbi:MAG: polysaccharide deacetylase family protein [Clostridia bacterium]|nr:polysaccharide deacetylase family protein [Clostridia bacterium]